MNMLRRYWPSCVLFLIFFFTLIIRLGHLYAPLFDAHYFRQTQTATVAKNFYLDGIDLFHPRIDIAGVGKEQNLILEFPFYQGMVAFIAKLVGYSDAVGKAVSIFWALATGIVLSALVQKLFKDRLLTLSTVIVFYFVPINIFYQQAYMIESTVVALHILSIYFWHEYLKKQKPLPIILFIGSTTLAFLQKSVYAPFLLATLLFMLIHSKKIRGALRIKWLAPLFCCGMVLLLWQRYVDVSNISNGNPYFATSSTGQQLWNFGTISERFQMENWRLRYLIFQSSTSKFLIVPFLVGILVLLKEKRTQYRMLLGWLISMILYYVIFFRIQSHGYYLMVVIPIFSILASMGLLKIADCIYSYFPIEAKRSTRAIFLIVFFAFFSWKCILNSIPFFYPDRNMEHKLAVVKSVLKEKGYVLFLFPEYDWNSVYTYYTDRKGITAGFRDINVKKVQEYKKQGYVYMMIENYQLLGNVNAEVDEFVSALSTLAKYPDFAVYKL